jgi:hypothetical protein
MFERRKGERRRRWGIYGRCEFQVPRAKARQQRLGPLLPRFALQGRSPFTSLHQHYTLSAKWEAWLVTKQDTVFINRDALAGTQGLCHARQQAGP